MVQHRTNVVTIFLVTVFNCVDVGMLTSRIIADIERSDSESGFGDIFDVSV